MKRLIMFVFSLLVIFSNRSFAQIAAWDFSGLSSPATAAATIFNGNLSSSNLITRGAGATASTASNSFRTQGFQNNGISVSNTDYFQITIGAATGYKVSLSSIDARFAGTSSFYASPGVTSQFAYSTDGTNFTLIGSPVQSTSLTMTQINLSGISELQNVASGTTITIRYYASGQTTTGGWGFASSSTAGTNGLAIGGTVNLISGSSSTSSDITSFSGYSYPTNIDYKSYQATEILNDGTSLEIAKFTVRDGGASADADAFPTTLTSISFSLLNYSNIRRIALYDGASKLGETSGGGTVNFSGLSLSAPDDASKSFSVRATFNTTITDNQNIQLTVASVTADASGSSFASGNAGGAATDNTGNNNKLAVIADRLSFITNKPPAAVAVGKNFPVYVKAVDANGSTDLDAVHSVTLSVLDGSGLLSSASGLTQSLALGVFSWTDIQFNTAESFTIQAEASGLTSVTSSPIIASSVLSPNNIMITHYSPQFNASSDEYIVLFNNTESQIDLNGYEIAYSSSTGSVPSAKISWTSSTIIPAKKYRLLATSSTFSVGTVVNKTADETYTSFASQSGQVAFRLTNGGDVIYALATGTISNSSYYKFDQNTSCTTTGTGGYYLTGDGGLYTRSGDNNIDYTYIAASNISDIPNSGTAALPVELSGFSSFIKGQEVQLVWSTATEVNNMGFDVERNAGGSWEKIGFVKGNGNSYSSKGYSFTDKSPLPGKVQYRLKQIDTDGKYKYYDEITVNVDAPKDFKLMQNSPNPFNPSTAIKFQLPVNTFVTIKVYDQIGREVATLINQEQSAGSHIVYWNGRDNNGQMVSSGMYLYRISAGNFAETRKMNLLK